MTRKEPEMISTLNINAVDAQSAMAIWIWFLQRREQCCALRNMKSFLPHLIQATCRTAVKYTRPVEWGTEKAEFAFICSLSDEQYRREEMSWQRMGIVTEVTTQITTLISLRFATTPQWPHNNRLWNKTSITCLLANKYTHNRINGFTISEFVELQERGCLVGHTKHL